MNYRKMPQGYGIVQTSIMQLKDLSIQAKAIYALLASYTGGKEYCFPSIKKIGEDVNLSSPMVIKYINELVKKNLVTKSKLSDNPWNHSNKYQVLYMEVDYEDKAGLMFEIKPALPSINNNNNNNNNIYKRKFQPPALSELKEYNSAHGLNIDCEFFLKYFTESNWRDSTGKKVKNWKQKMLTWSRNNKDKKRSKTTEELYG